MKIRTPYIVLFLVFVVLGVYYPLIFAPANSLDDYRMINGFFNSGQLSLKGLFFPGGSGYYYRPLLWLTYIADYHLWGMQESFMHLENVLLHAMNVVLVFFIAREIFRRYEVENLVPSLCAALLFALHPINTEPVNWISGRTDLLAGAFILLSLFLLLRSLAAQGFFFCILGACAFLLACFAKDSALFFFPASLLIIWHSDKRTDCSLVASLFYSLKTKYVFYSSYFCTVLAYFAIRHIAFAKADTGIATAASGVVGPNSHLLYTLKVVVKLLGFYVKKLFVPWPLNFAIIQVSDYYIILGIIVIIFSIYLVSRRELVADLFLTSICIISPAFLVGLSKMAWTPVAERYLYIPSATFCIGMTFIFYRFSRHFKCEKIVTLLSVLLFSATAYATVSRNIIWQDNLTLYQDTNQKTPNYPAVKNELAVALKDHGRHEEGNRLIKGNVVSKDAKHSELYDMNRAKLLCEVNDFKAARRLLLDNLNPSSRMYPELLVKLVDIDFILMAQAAERKEKEKIRQELITLFTKLQESTGDPYFFYKLGQQHLSMGNKVEARRFFVKAFDAAPEDAFYRLPAKKLAEKLKQ